MIRFLFLVLLFAGMASCSLERSQSGTAKLSIVIEAKNTGPFSLNSAPAAGSEFWMSALPTSIAGFSCLSVNVTGIGIPSRDNEEPIQDPLGSSYCTYPGVMSELLPVAGTVSTELDVPTGPARKIQVLGIQSTIGCPVGGDSFSFLDSLSDAFLPNLLEVGAVVADVFQSKTLGLTSTYVSSNPHDVRCGSGGGGDPTSVAGLLLWLQPEGVTGTVPGAVISNWTDDSGVVPPATFTPSVRPFLESSDPAINGHVSVSFSAGAGPPSIDKGLLDAGEDATIFAVARYDGTAGAIMGQKSGANGWSLNLGTSSFSFFHGATPSTASGLSNSGVYAIYTALRKNNGSSSDIKLVFNGAVLVAETLSFPSTLGGSVTYFGSSYTGAIEPLAGRVAEIILYNWALDDENRQKVECYLHEKYGIGSLPFTCH